MKKKLLVFVVSGFVIIVVIGFFFYPHPKDTPVKDIQDPSRNPIYQKYTYEEKNIIYIGVQPLYLPTGIITETMKRDLRLNKDLAALGKTVRFYPYLKGNDMNHFLRIGKIQGGVGGDMPALTIAATHKVFIPMLMQFGPISLITPEPILLKDLKGGRIGNAFGSNAHFALHDLLSSADLTVSDVQIVPMEVTGMISALKKKEIDAFCAWEPTSGKAVSIHSWNISHQRMGSGFLYFDDEFQKANPKAVTCIMVSGIRAILWLKKDRANLLQGCSWAIKASAEFTGRPPDLSVSRYAQLAEKDLLGRHSISDYRIPENSLAEKGSLNKEYIFLKDIGMIISKGDWKEVRGSFDRLFMDAIFSSADSFGIEEFEYLNKPLKKQEEGHQTTGEKS